MSEDLIADTEGKQTHIFPLLIQESEAQTDKKMETGYTELPQFKGFEDEKHYNCFSCEYMKKSSKSPTGYVCKKFGYYDQPWGCCDGYEIAPRLREYE